MSQHTSIGSLRKNGCVQCASRKYAKRQRCDTEPREREVMNVKTMPEKSPPNKPPVVATAFAGDDAEEIAERILSMTEVEVVSLWAYIGRSLKR